MDFKQASEQYSYLKSVYKMTDEEYDRFIKYVVDYGYEVNEALSKARDLKLSDKDAEIIHESVFVGRGNQNYQAAQKLMKSDFADVWNFLLDNYRKTGYTAREVSKAFGNDTAGKRMSDLKNAGLLVYVCDRETYNRAGDKVSHKAYNIIGKIPFSQVANKLQYIPKSKELQYNKVGKEAFEKAMQLIRDRSKPYNERIQAVNMFVGAMYMLVDNNPQTDKVEDRFRTLPNSYEGFIEFLSQFDGDYKEKVDNLVVDPETENSNKVKDSKKYDGLISKLQEE